MNEWVSEWLDEWVIEWVNEWVGEWMNEWVIGELMVSEQHKNECQGRWSDGWKKR